MSRLLFEAHQRMERPSARADSVLIEPPPELPRIPSASLLRKALPWVIGLLIIGMIVALLATGMRLISPQTLFFPFVLLLAAVGLFRGAGPKTSIGEIDAERADYLRYLSALRSDVRERNDTQRAALEWSHPSPSDLVAVPGTPRQWERDPGDEDFLVVRAGIHVVPASTTLRVGDASDEIDLEPVCHSALRALIKTQRYLPDAPATIDLRAFRLITLVGDRAQARGVVRAWAAHAVAWHDPAALAVAAASPGVADLAGALGPASFPGPWSWLKWLPHVDLPGHTDGAGPARRLTASARELPGLLDDLVRARQPFAASAEAPQPALRHVLVLVDDPLADPQTLLPIAGLAGTTLVRFADDETNLERERRDDELVLRIAGGSLERREHGVWSPFVERADTLDEAEAAHLARRLGRWDSNPARSFRTTSPAGTDFVSLLGIEDASQLDTASLWAPKPRAAELRVPIGLTSAGEPLFFDLKDESEGGMGPHGLMIGMTGSGKSQTLMAMLLALLTTHPADRLVVIYADFKGEAGADAFRNFPQVVTVISNLAEKRSIADRFADTLLGEVARREQLLREAGRKVRGSAFGSVAEYEEAAAQGHVLEPIPTLFVVADEFTLMLAEHPEHAELFDTVARKGRSLRVHILFASQTLDVGKIKDIDKNTSYRICLKVASASVSRQVIGVESAYHIESGKEHKGVGYFVSSPGAAPVKFRASYVDGVYEPPQAAPSAPIPAELRPISFTAERVTPDEHYAGGEAKAGVRPAPHARPLPAARPKKLIATIGEQLAELGPKAPKLWLPPLDSPISLGGLLSRAPVEPLRWPIGEIDRPYDMRRDLLVFDAASAAGNVLIHGGPKSGKSTAAQTFVLGAAATNSPRDVQFYCLDFGGGRLAALRGLAHVGAVATPHDDELVRRVLAELRQLLAARRRVFREHAVLSVEEFRERRKAPVTEPALDDGFGEVFLVLDELAVFAKANTDQFTTKNPLLAEVTELATAGLAYGIHVVVTTTSWIDVPLAMRDGLGLRLELRLTDPRDSNVRDPKAMRKPADSVPVDQPGRGLTASAEHFLFAAPRLDGRDDADGLAEALSRFVDTVNKQILGSKAPPVRLLPSLLDPADLGPLSPSKDQVLIGLREEDLAPVTLDFAANPLMMVFGDTKSGKTSLLRHIIRALREQHGPEEIAFTVVDRRAHLADEPLFPDNERTTNPDRLVPAMEGLAALLEQRHRLDEARTQSSWNQTHYLLVDDVDQIPDSPAISGPNAGRRPWDPLLGLLSQASELGLRVIVTARAAGSGHTIMTNQVLRRCSDLQATALMLSGNSQDGGKIRGHRFTRLPPGRAVLLSENDVATTLQLAYTRTIEQEMLGRENLS